MPDDVDKFVSAEIPDKANDPELYRIVTELMIHGPCGQKDLNNKCIIEGECIKNFPKNY